jgi:glycosyltransferase involved in cell wall biosynthesis
MNIALVCDYSLDYLGGAQTAFLAEAQSLAEAGHTVVVVTPSERRDIPGGPAHVAIHARGTIPVLGLPLLRNSRRLRARLTTLFRGNAIDVVHVHSEFGLVAAGIDAALALGLPVVHTVHTFFWRTDLPRPVQRIAAAGIRLFQRWITGRPPVGPVGDRPAADAALCSITLATAQRATVVVSPSAHQRSHLVRAGLRDVEAIPNTVTTGARRHGEPLAPSAGPLRVVWIGRCVREKRLLEFVAACRKAMLDLPAGALEVEIVGEGPLLPAARLLARDVEAITFSGRLDTDGVARAFRRSHVLALTSSGFDNQPMTVVEALYAARGVLYVDAALTEGVDVAGILTASDSVDDMARAIVDLAGDPSSLVELSRRAGDAFSDFAPAHHARLLSAVYRDRLVSLAV